jgi:mono/diheme cytochrome c family protein
MDIKPDPKAEFDFTDLLRKPHKLFGYSYIYFVLLVGALGYLYITNLTLIGKNSISPLVLSDSSSFVKDIPFQSPSILPPVDVMKVSAETPELVAKGKELFKANCASCHGDAGEGNGPTAATLNPKPRNFHSLAGWTNGSKISQIYKTLQEGIVRNGMASYSYLPPADRFALIHYVRSFAPGQPVDSQPELMALETSYQLSKGSNISGQIPIKKAAELVVAEAGPSVATIRELAGKRYDRLGTGGEALFERFSVKKEKVLTAFILHGSSISTVDQFINSVTSDPVQAGFKADVVRLSQAQWASLYQFLSGLRGKK